MRILVTGATGFVGQHLLPALALRWPEAVIQGWGRDLALTDAGHVDSVIARFQPTHLIHLAGQASVPLSFADPAATYLTNVQGAVNLYQAMLTHSPAALILAVGSADPYGASFKAGEAVNEETPFQPLNPYAGSKAAAEMVALDFAGRGLKILRLRPFNHTGPGQTDAYVVSAFARQIAAIKAGTQPARISVGALDAERDFSDVRDIVSAYIFLLENHAQLAAGDALNIGSGRSRSIESILHTLIDLCGVDISVETDPARIRPTEIRRVAADTRRINALGWQCQISWQQTLDDLLTYWQHTDAER